MSIELDTAKIEDVDQLLALYFIVYGKTYPYKMCTDRDEMINAVLSPDILWLVMRDHSCNRIAASALFEMDRANRIGKLTGVVCNPDFRKSGLAYEMIEHGTTQLLEKEKLVNSIYATTRTISLGPQLMCLKAGFNAYGIFPNSHRLAQFETTTMLIKFSEEAKERRETCGEVLAPIAPIVSLANKAFGHDQNFQVVEKVDVDENTEPLQFEIIDAPFYVRRLFDQKFTDPYDRFFPFHAPNVLATSTNGEVEIFAHLNKRDGYCVIVTMNMPIFKLRGRLDALLGSLHVYGISYVEVLIGLNRLASIQTLLDKQFLPSAIYPAMRENGEKLQDFVVLSRSMEPLNFRGMAVDQRFKPFIDQYVSLWKSAHLDSLQVFDGYR